MTDYNPDVHCGAKTRSRVGRCCLPKGWGTDHKGTGKCRKHFGSSPNHNRAAQAEMARREVDRLGIPIETTAEEALLHSVWEAAGNVELLRRLVSDLDTAEGGIYVRTGSTSKVNEAEPHVLVRMYNEERDRLRKTSESCAKIGLSERMVRLAEAQGRLIAEVFERMLSDEAWGLSDEQRAEGRQVAGRHLRAVGEA